MTLGTHVPGGAVAPFAVAAPLVKLNMGAATKPGVGCPGTAGLMNVIPCVAACGCIAMGLKNMNRR